jgi:S1-C subfamily serine protease
MGISAAYKLVKQSIVAFTLKYIPVYDDQTPPPPFPTILGTGFVVREDGVIATNAHVVRAFQKAPRPPDAPRDEWPVRAIMLRMTDQGVMEIPLEVIGVGMISGFNPGKVYYGPKDGPDIAFVHVKARGLPAVQIDRTTFVEEGMELVTAGFPMGTDALTAPGWLHQLTPTLQRGIVSAVLPFACPTPHGYSINLMSQGGASGSPVFSCETGAVIGVLYGGLNDIALTLRGKDPYKVPTNITYVVPSHYLINAMAEFAKHPDMQLPPDAKTVEEMIAQATIKNVFEDGRDWAIRKVDAKAEEKRMTEIVRVDPADGGKTGG